MSKDVNGVFEVERSKQKTVLQGQSSLRRAVFALTERSSHFLTCLWVVKIELGTFLSS